MKKTIILFVILDLMLSCCGQIRTGAECMEDYLHLLKGKNVALCANQTSLVGNTHLVDTLLADGIQLTKIFCPEHGFRGQAEAGAQIHSSTDPETGLPIISLYGRNKKPTAEQLHNIDLILFDLQDVGCRFYTYISTLHYIMKAAVENDLEVIVLDRPNPNGYFVDGPMLDTAYQSFVGMHPVPVVYGMTIGEYALMINGEHWLSANRQCRLSVIKIQGYTHETRYRLPVAPSPNLPTPESVYLYPSLCLFEGTIISVGRGTNLPFQIYGAPNLQSGDYSFIPQPIKGVAENPPHSGKLCKGHNLHDYAATHLDSANGFRLEYLLNAYRHYPDKEHFFSNPKFFDRLAGSSRLREQIVAGMTEEEIRAAWEKDLQQFKTLREKYLLYE